MFLNHTTPPGSPRSEGLGEISFEVPSRLFSGGYSRTGRSRAHNEDSFRCEDAHRVYAVADGIGGRPHGEVASGIAVGSICRVVANANGSHRGAGQILEDALHQAHRDVCRAMVASDLVDLRGMGTTLVALHFGEDRIARIAHVGDSRAYRVRDGKARRLTADHTVANELDVLDQGRLPAKFSRSLGHILTRAIGLRPGAIEVANLAVTAAPGDAFLLCSDGLSKVLDDEVIASYLGDDADPGSISSNLVDCARRQGSRDDITAVVVRLAA